MANEQAKHTPGPWSKEGYLGGQSAIAVAAPGKRGKQLVALVSFVVGYLADTTPEAEANANLIAAAPDLLAACKEALARFDLMHAARGLSDFEGFSARRALQEAIAKAEVVKNDAR